LFSNKSLPAGGVRKTFHVRRTFWTVAWACAFLLGIGRPAFCLESFVLPFEGQIDFAKKRLVLGLLSDKDRPLTLTAWITEDGANHFTLNLEDQKIFGGMISTLLEGELQNRRDSLTAGLDIVGTLRSRYTLINRKPGQEVEATVHLTQDRLMIRSLTSEAIQVKGFVQVSYPYAIDLTLDIRKWNIAPFLEAMNGEEARTSFGPFEGRLRLNGKADRIEITGRLLTSDGIIDGVDYQDMLLNVEGIYPMVHVDHSHIIQPDGTIFKIAGDLDLSRMDSFDKQIRRFISQPLIQQDGQDLEWTLKRLHQEGSNTVSELKYLYRKNETEHPTSREDGVIFGLETQHKF